MANRPANAGASWDMAPTGDGAPPPDVTAPPAPAGSAPAVQASPVQASPVKASHRATRAKDRPTSPDAPAVTGFLAWLPYLVVLAGAAAGMYLVSKGSAYALRGTAVLGGTLLAAALTRLLLPNRFAGLLASRRKALDVLAFAVLGTAVLAVALSLP